jgi:hypothetical protein
MNADVDYENPPVVKTVLGVQFEPLATFSNAHLGAFWKRLDADAWPITKCHSPPKLDRPVISRPDEF